MPAGAERPLPKAVTNQTGIAARSILAVNGLVARPARESRNSPCDVPLLVDIGRLQEAASRDLAERTTPPSRPPLPGRRGTD